MPLFILRKLALLVLIMGTTHTIFAFDTNKDTTLKIINKSFNIKGDRISTVYLTNNANKRIGEMPVYSFIDSNMLTVSFYLASKVEGAYLLIIQSIPLKQLKGKKAVATAQKAFVNPEMNTSPKQHYEVSIQIREPNNNVVNIGETIDIRSTGTAAEKQTYLGVNNLIPFATKLQASTFATKLNKLFAAYK